MGVRVWMWSRGDALVSCARGDSGCQRFVKSKGMNDECINAVYVQFPFHSRSVVDKTVTRESREYV